jgi:SAM-dependent methyltransferase
MAKDTRSTNPWLKVPWQDYEGHMGSPGVSQLEMLGQLFCDALHRFRPEKVAVIGCATGNGFEHIDPAITNQVVGIDINAEYLDVLQDRFAGQIPELETRCGDIMEIDLNHNHFDLVSAGLVFEYVDAPVAVSRISEWIRPGGVLAVVLQLRSPDLPEISSAGFNSLDNLSEVMQLVEPAAVHAAAGFSGLREVFSQSQILESGKSFWVGHFKKDNP